MKGTFTFEYVDHTPNVTPFEEALADQGFTTETRQEETSLRKAVYIDVTFDGFTKDEVMAKLVNAYNKTMQHKGLTFDRQDLSETVDAIIAMLELYD